METVRFDQLDLYPQVLRAIAEMGFEEATPIQSQAIPVVMSGVDVIGQAQTGTGKTASFGIPVLHKVDPNNKKTQVIILSPTRELAIQVADEIRKLAKYMHGVKILPVYGGQEISRQIKALKGGAQIIIGTPGRVMDHLRRKTIRCEAVNTIVLDEADEMLNMGFREDIETILEYIPEEGRQTVLFSATMPKPILDITKKYQHDAVTIKVVKKELTVPNIEQYYYDVKRKDKIEVLTRLLDYYNPKLSLVFCNTKRMVDELTEELQGRGYFAEGLHGDMKQTQRDRVMRGFRTGKTEILIATDVAARGIDVDDVEAVFNYDLPQADAILAAAEQAFQMNMVKIQNEQFLIYSTREGLLQFAKTGLTDEIPEIFYHPLTVEQRIEVLKGVRQCCETGVYRFLQKPLSHLPHNLHFCIRGTMGSMVFRNNTGQIIVLNIEETCLVSIFRDYLEHMNPASYCSTEKATELVDQIINDLQNNRI